MSATKMTGLSAVVLTGGMVLVGPSASALTEAVPGGASQTGTSGSTGDVSGVQQTSVGHRCGALFAHSHAHGAARAAEVADGGPAATAWWNSLEATGIATTDLSGRGLHCGLLAKSVTPAPATVDDQKVVETPDTDEAEVEATEDEAADDKATEDKADSDEADSSYAGTNARSDSNASSPGRHGWAGHGWAGHQGRHHRGGAGR